MSAFIPYSTADLPTDKYYTLTADPSYEGQILVLTYPLVGSYGVPKRDPEGFKGPTLPAFFESSRIHIAGLVVGSYSGAADDYSHFLADSELGQWLAEEGVPAIYGVDTRAITKMIREKGSLLCKMLAQRAISTNGESETTQSSSSGVVSALQNRASRLLDAVRSSTSSQSTASQWRSDYVDIPFDDPNVKNLVATVSLKEPKIYSPKTFSSKPSPPKELMHPTQDRPLRILAVDVGMKFNQIRCFVLRGVELKVVPWDYDFLAPGEEPFDGLFISNGPGDPVTVSATIDRLKKAMDMAKFPIFGICLGHQLLGLASGAKTTKLKYGNRGQNIPCTNLISGRCYITSQNHGYAVEASSLQSGWKELFVNANDGSNEGIYSTTHPYFSVQFHPESTPGPRDTEFLFDVFISNVLDCAKAGQLVPIKVPGGLLADNIAAYPRVHVKKVLVLGSGGLSIGQAGEFDYSGSQAIKALKQEGIYTVLINRASPFRAQRRTCVSERGGFRSLCNALFLLLRVVMRTVSVSVPCSVRPLAVFSVASSRFAPRSRRQLTSLRFKRRRDWPTRSTSCPSHPSSSARSSSTSVQTASMSLSVARPRSRSVSR